MHYQVIFKRLARQFFKFIILTFLLMAANFNMQNELLNIIVFLLSLYCALLLILIGYCWWRGHKK